MYNKRNECLSSLIDRTPFFTECTEWLDGYSKFIFF